MIRILLVLFIFFSPYCSLAAEVTLDGTRLTLNQHPRIFVGGNISLTALRAKMTSDNKLWTDFRDYFIEERASNPDYTGTIPDGSNRMYMESYAMLYMLDPVTFADMGAAAKELLLSYPAKYQYRSSSAATDWARFYIVSIAKTYDWIYPLLSETDKQAINTAVNEQIYAEALQGFSLATDYHNLSVTQFNAELIYGLATYEDNGPSDGNGSSGNNSQAMFEKGYASWKNYKTKYADPHFVGGHTYSGSAYGFNRVTTFCLESVEVLHSALGIDNWDNVAWAGDILQYFIYTTLPSTSDRMYPDGNVGGDRFDPRKLTSVFMVLSRLYKTPIGQQAAFWLAKTYDIQNVNINRIYKSNSFFWYDKDYPQTDYTARDTGYSSTGVGLYQARSDWSDTATFWALSSAEWLADHQGWDHGSFKIWRQGDWLIYENGADGNGMSTNTNMLFLDDGYVKSAYNKIYYTGGFAYTNMLQNTSATINRSESNSDYNYARGNLTNTYADNRNLTAGANSFYKLEHFSREMFHIKSSDYIILFDNINSAAGMGSSEGIENGNEVLKTLRLHFPNKPDILSDTFSYSANNSRIIGKVILPPYPQIKSVQLTDMTSGISTDTPYRLDIVKSESLTQHDNFLTVFRSGSKDIAMADTSEVNGTNIAGVYIDDETQPFIAIFSNLVDGSNMLSTDFTTSTQKEITIYMVGLTPSKVYNITITGDKTESKSLTTSQAGILSYKLTNTGFSKIHVEDPSPLVASGGETPLPESSYPFPDNAEMFIVQ